MRETIKFSDNTLSELGIQSNTNSRLTISYWFDYNYLGFYLVEDTLI